MEEKSFIQVIISSWSSFTLKDLLEYLLVEYLLVEYLLVFINKEREYLVQASVFAC